MSPPKDLSLFKTRIDYSHGVLVLRPFFRDSNETLVNESHRNKRCLDNRETYPYEAAGYIEADIHKDA